MLFNNLLCLQDVQNYLKMSYSDRVKFEIAVIKPENPEVGETIRDTVEADL
jgi:hypothetical protein